MSPSLRSHRRLLVAACTTFLAVATCLFGACNTGSPASPTLPWRDAAPGTPGTPGTPGAPTTEAGGADSPADAGGPDTSNCAFAFTTDTPNTYVAKVKNILLGLPPTDQEIAAVVDGGAPAFSALVDTWMTGTASDADGGPSYAELYQTKMLRFFELAFQQTQVAATDFSNEGALFGPFESLFVENEQEMFARTVLALNDAGVPFNQSFSTHQLMMTTALKSHFGFLDVYGSTDTEFGTYDTYKTANPAMLLHVSATGTPDPVNGVFVDPTLTITGGCSELTFPASGYELWHILGAAFNFPPDMNNCLGATATGQFLASDFSDWTMVTITQPTTAAAPPFPFHVLSDLRSGGVNYGSMVLNRPSMGFFTTPAFFANWQTNDSNQMRVTTNQALIVATGAQVDGTDTTTPQVDASAYGLSPTHAVPGSQCITCHWLLDPTREIFANTLTWEYGFSPIQPQPTIGFFDQPAYFMFQGVQAPMTTLADFGSILSSHPLVPSAWAQKLCYYVNSAPCSTDDPEFQRIVALFGGSFSWNALVKALVTSPMTTHASATPTALANCEPVAVSRVDHLCAALNVRLGFQDICNLQSGVPSPMNGRGLAIVPSFPSDGYARGSLIPILPNAPSLFYRTGVENFCSWIATLVIDNTKAPAGARTWSSTGCTATDCPPIGSSCTGGDGGGCATVGDFVTLVAGLPSTDPRAPLLAEALLAHFGAALEQTDAGVYGLRTAALQSAFVAACMSPSAISIGL